MIASHRRYLDRLRAAVDPASQTVTDAQWIAKNTRLKGLPFSFLDHEYQLTILQSTARRKYVRKCSQVGISELSVRRAIAKCATHAGVNVMYVLQTAGFANTFSSTRLAPVLESSPIVRDMLYKTDTSMLKRFVNGSFIHMKGASKGAQAISVPVDFLIVDEKDFAESQDILSSFESRTTHSDFEDEIHLSTPTVSGYGISHDWVHCIQHVELQKCNHCGHWFQPDYYAHVKLPGFNWGTPASTDRSLLEISYQTKELIAPLDLTKAFLQCPNPKCLRPTNQHVRYRKFVQVNPDAGYEEHGFQITPFSAPKHAPPGKLVRKSTAFRNVKDFVNNTLGLPHDDSTTGLSDQEIARCFSSDAPYALYPRDPPYQVSGTDLGGTCAHVTGYPAPDGHLRVVTAERLPLHLLAERFPASLAQNSVIASAMDALPYTDTVLRLQTAIPSLWAVLNTIPGGLELYRLRDQEPDETKATFGLRQIGVNRDALLDLVVSTIRTGQMSFDPRIPQEEQDAIKNHLRSLKRINKRNVSGEDYYTWVKTDGKDHYFFALSFLILATFVKGLAGRLDAQLDLVSKFRRTA